MVVCGCLQTIKGLSRDSLSGCVYVSHSCADMGSYRDDSSLGMKFAHRYLLYICVMDDG